MEMHQIRYFLAVSRTLNFTRAAEECHVAQPSLTRAIKQLEEELGGLLFRRERGLTHVTELGIQLLPALQRCYDSALKAKMEAKTYGKVGGSCLNIGLSPGATLDVLSDHIKQAARDLPGLEIDLRRGTSADILNDLKMGRIELALAADLDGSWDRLDTWHLDSDRATLVVHRSHKLASRDMIDDRCLATERLFMLAGGEHSKKLLSQCGSIGVATQEIGALQDIVSLVQAGVGAAVLSERIALPNDLMRIEIAGLDLQSTMCLHAAAGRPRSAATVALLKSVRKTDTSAGARRPRPNGGISATELAA